MTCVVQVRDLDDGSRASDKFVSYWSRTTPQLEARQNPDCYLGFNALIHHHRPDLINFNSLRPDDHMANLRYLQNADGDLAMTS